VGPTARRDQRVVAARREIRITAEVQRSAVKREPVASTATTPSLYGWPGSGPTVAPSGLSNGIIWRLSTSQYCTKQSSGCVPAILYAYDATNLGNEPWDSSQASGYAADNAVRFTVPTVANGKVYVGTRGNDIGGVYGSTSVSGELDVYGLKPN
jgi:hypothetical protein